MLAFLKIYSDCYVVIQDHITGETKASPNASSFGSNTDPKVTVHRRPFSSVV